MKTLLNEYDALNDDGRNISENFLKLIHPFLDNLVDEGYSTMELESVLMNELVVTLGELRILKALKNKRKTEMKTKTKKMETNDEDIANTFNLYKSLPGFKKAHLELKKVIDECLEKIRDCMDKHVHMGASDTASREAIAQYLFDEI